MTNPAVAADLDEPLDIHRGFSSQVALNLQVVVDIISDLVDIVLFQIANAGVGIDTGLCKDPGSGCATDPVDVGQADLVLIAEK